MLLTAILRWQLVRTPHSEWHCLMYQLLRALRHDYCVGHMAWFTACSVSVMKWLPVAQAAINCGNSDFEGGPVCHPVRAGRADHHGWKKTQRGCASSGQRRVISLTHLFIIFSVF